MDDFKVNESYCRMVKINNIDSLSTALDCLNQFMVAGMDYIDAEKTVLKHFKGVSQIQLSAAWDNA